MDNRNRTGSRQGKKHIGSSIVIKNDRWRFQITYLNAAECSLRADVAARSRHFVPGYPRFSPSGINASRPGISFRRLRVADDISSPAGPRATPDGNPNSRVPSILFRGQDTGSAATLRNLKPERFWAYAEEQSKSEPTLTMAEKEVRHGN